LVKRRKELVRKLRLAKSTLARASESNSRRIIQIEKNIRALNREISASEKRKNISDRQKIASEQTQTQIYKDH
jgi:TolA-binding protein